MAEILVRVQYRLQYERQADRRETCDLTIEDDPSDIVLRSRARAHFWPDIGGHFSGVVTAVIVEKVMRPGEYDAGQPGG